MADIKVSTQEIHAVAEEIRGSNTSLMNLLDGIYNTATNLQKASWVSDASTEFCKKIESFKTRTFENYKNYTDDYQKFLDRTADNYESTEQTNIDTVESKINDSAVGVFT